MRRKRRSPLPPSINPDVRPEAGTEGALYRRRRVPTARGDIANRVLLLEREPRGKGSQPGTRTTEGVPPHIRHPVWARSLEKLDRSPSDAALALLEQ